jgi:hypothetical protein
VSFIDRVREKLTNRPSMGKPSPGKLMDRGGGEEGGHHDEERELVHRRDLGTPNETIEDHVRPPLP